MNERAERSLTEEQLRENRLDAFLESLGSLLTYHGKVGTEPPRWYQFATRDLASAREAFADGNREKAWVLAKQSFRLLYHSMEPEELRQRAILIRREADDKLKHWRREAVLDLLGRDPSPERQYKPQELILAQFVIDTHFDNVYFEIENLAVRMRALTWTLSSFVVLVLVASGLLNYFFPNPTLFLFLPEKTALVALLGATGAVLTYALAALGTGQRIPQALRGHVAWAIRPAVGALSAIAVCLIVESGVLPIKEPEGIQLYAWAVLAGLSERILDRMVRSAEKSLQ